ncbi:hypothetical protein MLD52_09000 [Puniceicoccaceae bacterium K14]|nr:hypothetical protein [Puniceicoccaceae bacterium K14]
MKNNQIEVSGEMAPAAVSAAQMQKARIESAYTIALNKPRSIDSVRQNILRHCERPRFAEKVKYSKPVGGSSVTGPTVRFAEMALREMTNIFTNIQVIHEDDKKKQIQVILCDLETNTQFTKEVTLNKTVERKNKKGRDVVSERKNTKGETVYVVVATEDELLNKEAALISKALRNEGLRLIPQDIIEEAMDIAEATMKRADAKDPEGAKNRLIDAFFKVGVKVGDLIEYLGHPIDTITPAELDELRAMHSALREGSSKWSDYVESPTKVAEAKEKRAAVKATEKKGEKLP